MKVVFLNVDYEDFHIYLTLDVFHLIVSQTVSYRYQVLWPPAEDWVLPWESSAHNTGSVWLISLMFSWSCFILSESLYTICWLSPSSCHSQPQLFPHILGKRAPQWLEELRMGGGIVFPEVLVFWPYCLWWSVLVERAGKGSEERSSSLSFPFHRFSGINIFGCHLPLGQVLEIYPKCLLIHVIF